jgi:hypothetical protein
VILRWHIQRNVVVIPMSVKRDRMTENFAVFDFELNEEDMKAIKAVDTKTTAFFDQGPRSGSKGSGLESWVSVSAAEAPGPLGTQTVKSKRSWHIAGLVA